MKFKDKIRVLLALLVIFSGYFQFFTPNTKAVSTISTISQKDSYVSDSTYGGADANYGGKDWLIFGDYILGWNEVYLYFNFADKPADWTKAEISLDMYYISETFKITVSLISTYWNELSITWQNKPAHGEVITTFTVAEEKIYRIDVTNYIASRDSIAICINASDYLQGGYVQTRSREGSLSWSPEGDPQLIWTYPEVLSEITSVYIVIGAVCVICVVIYLLNVSHKRKALKTNPRYIQQSVPPSTVREISIHPNVKIKFCVKCGKPSNIDSKFCKDCGKKMVI